MQIACPFVKVSLFFRRRSFHADRSNTLIINMTELDYLFDSWKNSICCPMFIQLLFQKQQTRVHHERAMDNVFREISIGKKEELLANEIE